MFNLGAPEIIMIAIVALIVFGPDRIPEFARIAARTYREFRRITSEVQSTVHETMSELQQEPTAELKPSRSPAEMEFSSPPPHEPAATPNILNADGSFALLPPESQIPMPGAPAWPEVSTSAPDVQVESASSAVVAAPTASVEAPAASESAPAAQESPMIQESAVHIEEKPSA